MPHQRKASEDCAHSHILPTTPRQSPLLTPTQVGKVNRQHCRESGNLANSPNSNSLKFLRETESAAKPARRSLPRSDFCAPCRFLFSFTRASPWRHPATRSAPNFLPAHHPHSNSYNRIVITTHIPCVPCTRAAAQAARHQQDCCGSLPRDCHCHHTPAASLRYRTLPALRSERTTHPYPAGILVSRIRPMGLR